jgi:hypothetical protein
VEACLLEAAALQQQTQVHDRQAEKAFRKARF